MDFDYSSRVNYGCRAVNALAAAEYQTRLLVIRSFVHCLVLMARKDSAPSGRRGLNWSPLVLNKSARNNRARISSSRDFHPVARSKSRVAQT
jgi:hypothetical protein